mmetsp:Transcript_19857/g.22721  ORF Transcript_19857/g.22721 Transcript_19857/m.22721 type:complete len:133 (+) Transcript_19857:172-570(+)
MDGFTEGEIEGFDVENESGDADDGCVVDGGLGLDPTDDGLAESENEGFSEREIVGIEDDCAVGSWLGRGDTVGAKEPGKVGSSDCENVGLDVEGECEGRDVGVNVGSVLGIAVNDGTIDSIELGLAEGAVEG